MALTGKQVRHLRSLAHHLDPVVLVGKSGVNSNVVSQANAALEARELIKCGVQDGCLSSADEVAHELAEQASADVVQVIGHKFSLYRRSEKPGIEHIQLP
ncbi:ribosome assembly RNA-binding protein YhbY [uncultured Parolsenella sp.]|uniref:ribosome assembly RNA-binding protein YhbY n=1 Tax=uncultured Parolsenella sp. TaxID=2083008 RepID=UPI0027D964C7|nr:ribosome assembly RNA-binding protein YhbY [uncultured Parolsenella sp.]